MTKEMRFKISKYILLFWCLFIGVGAVFGAIGMISDPTGKAMQMNDYLRFFQVLPFSEVLFQDYTFSGISLFIVNGITNLTAAVLILLKKKIGIVLGCIFGITLMMWITIQFVIFPLNYMSTIFFIFGIAQAVCGYCAIVYNNQLAFVFDEKSYQNIGKKSSELVVYFSRMGYVKKIAYEKANEIGADVYEIKSTEKTNGIGGFLWCGRFGVSKMQMPIEKIEIDLAKYDKITIVSPIWVFDMCAPIRTFLNDSKGKVKAFECVLVHFMNSRFSYVAKEMSNILQVPCEKAISVSCKMGKFAKEKQIIQK